MIEIRIQAEPADLDAHLRALGFIRGPVGVGEDMTIRQAIQLAKRPTASELEALLKADNGPAVHINPDGAIVATGPGPGPSPLADELAALERPSDLAPPVADPTTKRVRGQPSPGKKRRTKEEVEEDLAYAAQGRPMTPESVQRLGIQTGEENRQDPAVSAADAADEAAETAARIAAQGGKLTLEDVRAAVARYVDRHGAAAGVANVQKIIGCPLIQLPEAEFAGAISRLDHATTTGAVVLGAPNGAANAQQAMLDTTEVKLPLLATKDDVVAALVAYGRKYDGSEKPDDMVLTKEDMPKLFTQEFGKNVTGIGSMPKGKDGQPLPEACGKIAAAIAAATRDNPFGRTVRT